MSKFVLNSDKDTTYRTKAKHITTQQLFSPVAARLRERKRKSTVSLLKNSPKRAPKLRRPGQKGLRANFPGIADNEPGGQKFSKTFWDKTIHSFFDSSIASSTVKHPPSPPKLLVRLLPQTPFKFKTPHFLSPHSFKPPSLPRQVNFRVPNFKSALRRFVGSPKSPNRVIELPDEGDNSTPAGRPQSTSEPRSLFRSVFRTAGTHTPSRSSSSGSGRSSPSSPQIMTHPPTSGVGKSSMSSIVNSALCPKYDGKQSFRIFVEKFNNYTNAMNLTVADRLQMLPLLLLTSKATSSYKRLSETARARGPWKDVIQHLTVDLCPPEEKDNVIQQIHNLTQGKKSCDEFAEELESLAAAIFSPTSEERDFVLKTAFLNGLKPTIRKDVKRRCPPDYDTARRYASFEENISRDDDDTSSDVKEIKDLVYAVHTKMNITPSDESNLANPSKTTPPFPNRYHHKPNDSRVPYYPRNNNGNFGRFQRPVNGFRGRFGKPRRFASRVPRPEFRRRFNEFDDNIQDGPGRCNNHDRYYNSPNRSRYYVNTIQTPILLCICLFYCLIQSGYGMPEGYQICPYSHTGIYAKIPPFVGCPNWPVNEAYKVNVKIHIPNPSVLSWDGWRCSKDYYTLCVIDRMFFRTDTYTKIREESINASVCQQILKDRVFEDMPFEYVSKNLFRTPIPSYGERYFWHTGCVTKYQLSLQRGIITKLRDNFIITELILNTGNCKIHHGQCTDQNSTVIWTPPEINQNCEYRHTGPFRGLLSKDILLIDSLDSAFIFKNESIMEHQLSCFNSTPFVTTTKVLLTFPDLPPIPSISVILRHLAQQEQSRNYRRKRTIEDAPIIVPFERDYQNFVAYPFLRRTLDPLGSIELYKLYIARKAIIPSYSITRLFRFDPMMTARMRHLNVQLEDIYALANKWFYQDISMAVIHAFAVKEMQIVTNQAVQKIPTAELLRQLAGRMTVQDFIQQSQHRSTSMITFIRDLAVRLSMTPALLWNNDYVPSEKEMLESFFPPLGPELHDDEQLLRQHKESKEIMSTIKNIVLNGGATQHSINAEIEYIGRMLEQNRHYPMIQRKSQLPDFEKLFHSREENYGMSIPPSFRTPSYEIIVPSTSLENQFLKLFLEGKKEDLSGNTVTLAPQALIQPTETVSQLPIFPTPTSSPITRLQPDSTYATISSRQFSTSSPIIPYEIQLVEKELDVERRIAFERQRTALNYGFQSMRQDLISEFHKVYDNICHTQNEFIKNWQAILRINPTIGIRSLLQRNDISAHFVSRDILNIHACIPIEIEHIYHNHSFDGHCYIETPILSKTGRLYFALPGSIDVLSQASQVSCTSIITDVWFEHGQWRNQKGPINVSSLSQDHTNNGDINLPYIRFDTDYYGNFSSEDFVISLALSHAASLGMSHFTMLQIISDSNFKSPIHAFIAKSETLARSALNATQSVWESTKDFFVGTIERSLMTIGGVTIFLVVIGIIVFIIKMRYLSPIDMAKVNVILPYDHEAYPLTSSATEIDNIEQPVSPSLLAIKYPNIINFIPLIMPMLCVNNVDSHRLPFILTYVHNKAVKALWDSGASVSIVQLEILLDHLLFPLSSIHSCAKAARTANGSTLPFMGTIVLPIVIQNITIFHQFYVARRSDFSSKLLLGMDFMHKLDSKGYPVTLRPSCQALTIGKTIVPFVFPDSKILQFTGKTTPLRSIATFMVMPRESVIARMKLDEPLENNETAVVHHRLHNRSNLFHHKTAFTTNKPIEIKVFNLTAEPLKIRSNEILTEAQITIPVYERERSLTDNDDYIPPEADWEGKLPIFPNSFMHDLSLDKSDINKQQKERLEKIIRRNKVAFLNDDRKIGLFRGPLEHTIPLRTDMDFPRPRTYPIPLGKQEEVERQVKEMLDQGIIEPSRSLFTSPVVLVKKKDNTYRFVTDFRALNSMTRKQTYLIPNIYDIIDLAAGANFFTTFDLVSGFFQIPLRKCDRYKTAFKTTSGVYQYCRMPMGLCGAPHTFQTAVRYLQSKVKCKLFVYLDDLLIISNESEQHLQDIEEVLIAIAQLGLKIKLCKCSFAQTEVKFLGIIIGRDGVKTDPKKVEAISQFPVPKDVNSLRSFLGMTNYFRRFIKNYAQMSAPLYELLREKANWCWNSIHQGCVDQLKTALTTAPVLKPPSSNKPFIIESDASNIAIGAVLLQHHKDNAHPYPIAFASRKLVGAERRYPPIEIEGLGIVFALQQFRTYVLGTHTVVITDHKPLTSLMKRRDLIGRLAKFQLIIQEYDIDIQYRPGKENSVPDALSRYIGEEVNHPKLDRPKKITSYVNSILPNNEITMADLVKHTNLSKIQAKSKWIKDTIMEFDKPIENRNPIITNRYSLITGLLFTKPTLKARNPKLVIPHNTAFTTSLINLFHKDPKIGAHLGIFKTVAALKRRFHWTNMTKEVESVLKRCELCASRKIMAKDTSVQPLGMFKASEKPFDRIHADILGPLPVTKNGNKYILTIQDSFTKWSIATPLANITTVNTVKAFLNSCIYVFGPPRKLVTDNGSNFTSEAFETFCTAFQINHSRTPPYEKNSNGQVERLHRTIEECLTQYVNSNQDDWDIHLPKIIFSLNCLDSVATQVSPYIALFGCDANLPLDKMFPAETTNNRHNPSVLWSGIRQQLEKCSSRYKDYFDKRNRTNDRVIHLNDKVLISIPVPKNKLSPKYEGPFVVIEVEDSYVAVHNAKDQLKKYHKNRVKVFERAQVTTQ